MRLLQIQEKKPFVFFYSVIKIDSKFVNIFSKFVS